MAGGESQREACVVIDPAASPVERFAAREVRRYLYLRTGKLPDLKIGRADRGSLCIFVGIQKRLQADAAELGTTLAAQEYFLRSEGEAGVVSRLFIIGGDDIGTLYGAYRFAELLSVRFYLHGDVIPDRLIPLAIPEVNELGRPLFSVRGIQPFHDFAEGPDWWDTDDYLSIIGQLPKLRMNFLGLHTYPEGGVGPEPTVWIGRQENMDKDGRVTKAYPASYHTTGRSGQSWWAYAPLATSDFVGGASGLYNRDDYGSEVMRDQSFEKQTPAGSVEVFNRTASMLGRAFSEARRLGVLTCVGTETPLSVPGAVKNELKEAGLDPADPKVTRDLYRAIFDRISRACSVDYYWLWTTEAWAWEGNKPEQFAGTENDVGAALEALQDLGSPIKLATCGWVLGPQHDRAALDRLLPADSPMSAINPAVGYGAIDRQFANLSERPRWAIPWLENDGDLIAPQLWAGRMRYDAADALRLGCTGLIGIHWRTQILAPNIVALAAAAWDQSWAPPGFDARRIPPQTASGAEGGIAFSRRFASQGAHDPIVFRTNRIGMDRYDVLIPRGDYTVTLGFSELEDKKPGERVFSVTLQGRVVIDHLDLAAQFAAGEPAEFTFKGVDDTDGHIRLDFIRHAGEPCIASIQVEGFTKVGPTAYLRRINCGGPASDDFEADLLAGQARPPEDRAMPVAALYHDFAAANFGPEAAADISEIFTQIDGLKLPVPCIWIDGPGDILRNPAPWSEVSVGYSFVGRLEALRPRIHGAANLERYDYWLNQFRAFRLIGELGCTAGALDKEMNTLGAIADLEARRDWARRMALPLRIRLAELWTQLMHVEIAGASNVTELGTIANLEQRSRVHQQFLDKHDRGLVSALGAELPVGAQPSATYAGPVRIIVPTVRTSVAPGESLLLKVLLVAEKTSADAVLCWRPIGEGEYRRIPLKQVARWVYEVALPALTPEVPMIEYHIEAKLDGQASRWPASEVGCDQTLILFE
ncbi:MAG: malectin domain-containing carbohydrate-binding protein [Opitutaceae bacterium]|jgi:hypothetical protein